jgi:hypothetical protein
VVDGFKSQEYTINAGTPQGSPLSAILYLFYNADLIDECNQGTDAISTGYIDDVGILAWGNTTDETCSALGRILEKAQRWANTHASVFAPDKFQLTHFTRSRKRIDTSRAIYTAWGEVKPRTTCKYLGVNMDMKLQWKDQLEAIRRKATKSVSALSSLGGSTWGITFADMRKLYQATVLPQMMYACFIWSNASIKGRMYTKKTLKCLHGSDRVQAATEVLSPADKHWIVGENGWNGDEELQGWRIALDWWVGKCGFCAGRGLDGTQINHSLHRCKRGD